MSHHSPGETYLNKESSQRGAGGQAKEEHEDSCLQQCAVVDVDPLRVENFVQKTMPKNTRKRMAKQAKKLLAKDAQAWQRVRGEAPEEHVPRRVRRRKPGTWLFEIFAGCMMLSTVAANEFKKPITEPADWARNNNGDKTWNLNDPKEI